jgi:hypothetical protein
LVSAPDLWEAAVWVGFAGLFGIDTAWATISLVIALWSRARGHGAPTSTDLLRQMDRLYGDLRSDGLISASYILEKAKKADERGVGWPATLFTLLDDIIARSGRF